MILEACVESVDESIHAELSGANRLELCADLADDGLTPDMSVVLNVLYHVKIPVKVMIRCRAGDFFYTSEEITSMVNAVGQFKSLNIAGIVFGALVKTNHGLCIDLDAVHKICVAAYPVPVTIHKCIDLCDDICGEIKKLSGIKGVKSILSSGGKNTATEGLKTLNKMKDLGDKLNLEIIAAGKITHNNIYDLKQKSSITSFHGRRIV